jgi:hypothetical protein
MGISARTGRETPGAVKQGVGTAARSTMIRISGEHRISGIKEAYLQAKKRQQANSRYISPPEG